MWWSDGGRARPPTTCPPHPPTPLPTQPHVENIKEPPALLLRSLVPYFSEVSPRQRFCVFLCKIELFELLRTLSRGSQKFGPEVRRTYPLGSAEVWLAFSRGRLRGFAISIVGGFFAECFSESRLPLTLGSRFVAHRSRAHVQCKGQHPPLIIK